AADDCAGDNIRMSVEILRATVERKIKVPLCRTEIDGARKCVIDQRYQAVRPGELCYGLKVRDLQQWVADSLDIYRLRIRPKLAFPGIRIAGIDEAVGDAEIREVFRDE